MNELLSFNDPYNTFRAFTHEDMKELKEIESKTPHLFGYVYFLEYGNLLKIGCTKTPYKRIRTLKRQGEGYADKKIGRVALTPMCTNYVKIEKDLHKLFKDNRKEETELFNIDFRDAVTKAMGANLNFLDESEEIKKHQEAAFQFVKEFITGGH